MPYWIEPLYMPIHKFPISTMVYNKLVIPKQNPTAAASLISPAPTFLANNAGNEKLQIRQLILTMKKLMKIQENLLFLKHRVY